MGLTLDIDLALQPGSRRDLPPLVARAVLDPDRRADKPEGRPNLVLQKALIREVQLHRPVGEKNKGGRRYGGLRHVQNLDSLRHGYGRALKIDSGQKAVHLAGADALAPL